MSCYFFLEFWDFHVKIMLVYCVYHFNFMVTTSVGLCTEILFPHRFIKWERLSWLF